jgi:hypothetical protein
MRNRDAPGGRLRLTGFPSSGSTAALTASRKLEDENRRLKAIVAYQALDIRTL